MKRCLVHLYSPPYLLSALAALATLHPNERVAATVLVGLYGASEPMLADLMRVIRELADGHPQIERVEGVLEDSPDSEQLHSLLGPAFDELYYSHDATGGIVRALAAAYPGVRKVCTGDAFGMVYPADFVESYQRKPPVSVAQRLRGWLRAFERPAPLRPDIAALVLPVDPSGRGLKGVPLTICSKATFVQAIESCHANALGLQRHMRELLARTEGRSRYVLLTETYAEAGHVAAGCEAPMYAEIVRVHCKPGSAVIVKPHPLEAPGKTERIAVELGDAYEVIEIDRTYARHPFEIWLELARACTVICTAYPVLSLKYAHDIDVVQPMDDAFVERWIEPMHRRWLHDGLRLYMGPLARLPTWDGRSVLWPAKLA